MFKILEYLRYKLLNHHGWSVITENLHIEMPFVMLIHLSLISWEAMLMLWDTHKDNIRFHGSEHFIEKQKQNSFAFVNVSQHILNAFPNYNNKT